MAPLSPPNPFADPVSPSAIALRQRSPSPVKSFPPSPSSSPHLSSHHHLALLPSSPATNSHPLRSSTVTLPQRSPHSTHPSVHIPLHKSIPITDPCSSPSSPTIVTLPNLDQPPSRSSLSPRTAALSSANLTELAFLQSLLDPNLSRHDCHFLVGARVQRLIRDDDAGRMRKLSTVALATRRFPAIVLTVILELFVGAVVGLFGDLLEKHVVLVSFMPMISSICGNIGLQASTSTLRSLATGYASHTNPNSIRKVVIRELSAGFTIGCMLFLGLSLLVMIWSQSARTGFVCGLSIMLSASAAGVMGALAPIGFKLLGLDPALCAGPLETAVQDLVGISTYLSMARLFLP